VAESPSSTGVRLPGDRPPRLLVVKTSSMGDVVHTLPAVTDITRAFPGAQIDWLVEKPFAAIPALHPGVRQVLPMAWRKWRRSLGDPATRAAIGDLRQRLQAERYDLVLDFQGLIKSVMWAVQAHGPRAGYAWSSAREPLASLFYRHTAEVPRDLHAVERCRRLAAAHLGHALPATPPDFGLRAPVAAWQPPGPWAVLIPCASRPEKLWPEDRWRAVVRAVEARGWTPVVLWGSPQEEALAQRIAAGTSAVMPPFLTVADAAAVLAGAVVNVGLDTGFTHIAAAFGRPAVGIYCDFEPGLAGVTGSGFVRSLGGKGQVPPLEDVMAAFEAACRAAGTA
jgi:heptosyltransferase-1